MRAISGVMAVLAAVGMVGGCATIALTGWPIAGAALVLVNAVTFADNARSALTDGL